MSKCCANDECQVRLALPQEYHRKVERQSKHSQSDDTRVEVISEIEVKTVRYIYSCFIAESVVNVLRKDMAALGGPGRPLYAEFLHQVRELQSARNLNNTRQHTAIVVPKKGLESYN
jgi:hypothetical protein